jgi:hypothetical protein
MGGIEGGIHLGSEGMKYGVKHEGEDTHETIPRSFIIIMTFTYIDGLIRSVCHPFSYR